MRISDWSSDVCSSDLGERRIGVDHLLHLGYRDAGIVTAEMQDHRYARRFVEMLGHQSAVIAWGRGNPVDPRRRKHGDRAAIAITAHEYRSFVGEHADTGADHAPHHTGNATCGE